MHSNAESRIQNITRILGFINRAIDKLEQDPNLPSPSYEHQNFENSTSSTADNNLTLNGNNLLSDHLQTFTQSIAEVTEVGILAVGNDNRAIPLQPNQNFLNQLSADITEFLFNSNGQNRQNSNIINIGSIGDMNNTNSATTATNNTQSTTNTNANNQTTTTPSTNQSSTSSLGNFIGSLTQNIIGSSLGNFANNITSMTVPTINISTQSNSNNNLSTASVNSNEQNRTSTRAAAENSTTTTTASNQNNASIAATRNRRITWAEYAGVLDNVRQTQERFAPHFNSFQQSLLQRHGSLSASQAEEEQSKYRLIARCMHHISHVYHMCSEIGMLLFINNLNFKTKFRSFFKNFFLH